MDHILECFIDKKQKPELIEFLRYDTRSPVAQAPYIFDEKLAQLAQTTLALKANYQSNYKFTPELFHLANEQLKLLNRIAEWETSWITYPLYIVATQLFEISNKLDQLVSRRAISKTKKRGDLDEEKFLEKCGRTIHTSFKLCLNDRDPTMAQNKKLGVYYFTNLEFKIYHKLQNRDMVKNLVKVLNSRGSELPSLNNALGDQRAYIVTYYYYMGEYYGCNEGDFHKAFEYLQKALMECNSVRRGGGSDQMNTILTLLVPFAMLSHRWYPNESILQKRYTPVANVYCKMFRSLLNGDLKSFDEEFAKNELLFLRKNLYTAISLLRELVLLKLIKRCWRENGSTPIVPLSLVAVALKKSQEGEGGIDTGTIDDEVLDDTECSLANLIAKGYIKGYLSHSNRCVVVSKAEPFPRLVREGS